MIGSTYTPRINITPYIYQMVVLAKRSLGEILSAMELMDAQSLDVVLRKPAWGLRNPLGGR